MKEYALKGDMSHSYSIVPVTVQAAYDEQVLVSGAWDETVATGYPVLHERKNVTDVSTHQKRGLCRSCG